MGAKVMNNRLLLRVSYVLLLALLVLSSLLLKPANASFSSLLAIQALQIIPLLLFLPAIQRENSYGLLMLSLILLFYMGFATMNCFAGGLKAFLAGTELTLELALSWFALRVIKLKPRGHGATH